MSAPAVIKYFEQMNAQKASDLYLTVGFPPTMRIEGDLQPVTPEVLTLENINDILSSILTNRQRRDFEV